MRLLILIPILAGLASAATTKRGTLLIDGKTVADNFLMEAMFHTMEAKPTGTVLDAYCGTPVELEGTKVCLATLVNRPKSYYVVLHKEAGETVFARSNLTILKRIPPIYSYQGFGVEQDPQFPKYQIEKVFELRITE